MRLETLALAFGAATGALAKTAYLPPPMLASKAAEQDSGCTLPREYTVRNFVGATNNTKKAKLTSFEFKFSDEATQINTRCQFNSSSTPKSPGASAPRYSCEDKHVQFIWQQSMSNLFMIERVCPGADGVPDYEAAGSVKIPIMCGSKSNCTSNATEYSSVYTSLQPIRDIQGTQMMWDD